MLLPVLCHIVNLCSIDYALIPLQAEGDILYGVIDISSVSSIKFIENSISLLGSKPGISLGKTSEKF